MSDDEFDAGGGQEFPQQVTLTAEMWEALRREGQYRGEDALGRKVSIREDIGSNRGSFPDTKTNAWGPIFDAEDPGDPHGTECVASSRDKDVMLRAEPKDIVEITTVHSGARRIPERLKVVKRTNTFHGPVIKCQKADEDDFGGQEHGWELTIPGPKSHMVLWKAVVDTEGYVHTRIRYSTVSATIRNVAAYDICKQCGEPIKDPMHRSVALFGDCSGGWNEEVVEDGES